MTPADTGATLNKLRRMIQALQREEMVQMSLTHSHRISVYCASATQLATSTRATKLNPPFASG